ncbi:MAG TPA: MFS transporter [Anaerolineaceae bacterium]|nr:MFS transporter [Anaerolineaceae bacterium]
MKRELRWYHHLAINSYWLGINIASGVITPILLPFLVVLYMPVEQKNTALATIRVVSLAVAMLVQPIAGMLSDRSTSRFGRRRPFIVAGALLNTVFLFMIGASTLFDRTEPITAAFGFTTAYAVLLAAIVLLQVSSNIGHGAVQALIPDVVPENQRGRSSGIKSVLELLPVFLVLFIGPLVDAGRFWLVVGIIVFGFLATMLTTLLFVKEEPQTEPPTGSLREPILRIVALTVIFVAITRAAVWFVTFTGTYLTSRGVDAAALIALVGIAGLIGMAGSIFLGVYLGARVGIGADAPRQSSFIWWVINRLMFLAAVGSIQGFAQFFLRDVLNVPNPATMTTVLLAVVALFLMPSAIFGGLLADKVGRKRLVGLAGLVAAAGTGLLLVSRSMPLVVVSGSIIGLGTGAFMATNWALGTDLVPAKDAGKFLGISNLAGAGAGIVGAGIGGPVADTFNLVSPGLGYLVIFAIYGALFLLSTATLAKVRTERAEPALFGRAAPVE